MQLESPPCNQYDVPPTTTLCVRISYYKTPFVAHNTTKRMFVPTYNCCRGHGQVSAFVLPRASDHDWLFHLWAKKLLIGARYTFPEPSSKTPLLYPALCTLVRPYNNTKRPTASLHTVRYNKWNAVSNELKNVRNDYLKKQLRGYKLSICTHACRDSNHQRAALHSEIGVATPKSVRRENPGSP